MTLACAVLDDYQNAAVEFGDWDSLGDSFVLTVYTDHLAAEDELVERLEPFDVIILMRERTPFPASLLLRLPRLKLLVTTGMRNAAIDLPGARSQGILVSGTTSYSEPPVELAWALILGLSRQLIPETASLRNNGPWQQSVGTDLHGATLGLLGFGRTGILMSRIGKAFGMRVTAWSENLTAERAEAEGVLLAPSKTDLLTSSDVVSIHLILSERTRGLVGPEELSMMRDTALLINTSRSSIVDQNALIEALTRRSIAGAGIDVFDQEPLPVAHPMRQLANVLATPHLGYVTRRNYGDYFSQAVENIRAFASGNPIRVL